MNAAQEFLDSLRIRADTDGIHEVTTPVDILPEGLVVTCRPQDSQETGVAIQAGRTFFPGARRVQHSWYIPPGEAEGVKPVETRVVMRSV